MTIKMLGIIIIIGTSTWLGFDYSKRYGKRVHELRQFILSLQMIEAEMVYSQLTLKRIFRNISRQVSQPVDDFYGGLATKMNLVLEDFGQTWEKELKSYQTLSALTKMDLEIIIQFGKTLGQHSKIEQQKHIILTIKHFERQLVEAIEQRMKYDKMTKNLGVLIGVFIVLLLF